MKKSITISTLWASIILMFIAVLTGCSMQMAGSGGTTAGQDRETIGTMSAARGPEKAAAKGELLIEAEACTNMLGIRWENCSEGGLSAGWIDAGDWLDYTVTLEEGGDYVVQYRVAAHSSLGKLQFQAGGALLGETAIPNTLGWQNWTTQQTVVSLPGGPQTIRLYASGQQFNLNWFKLSKKGDLSLEHIEAEEYSGFYDTTPGNAGGAYRNDHVDIQACSEGGFNVGWTEKGEWLEYPVYVPKTASYTAAIRVASKTSPGAVRIYLGERDITGAVTIPPTGDWQQWTTFSIPNVRLDAGSQVLKVLFEAGGMNINYMEFKEEKEEWVPYYASRVSTMTAQESGITVNLSFPHQGFRVTDWGSITRSGQELSVDIKVETWTGSSAMEELVLTNSYNLESLPGGTYTFKVNTWGTFAASMLYLKGDIPLPVVPGRIQAEDYAAYYDLSPGNTGGAYKEDDVDIQHCSEGGFNVGWIEKGEWLEYHVNAARAGDYLVAYRVAGATYNGQIELQVNDEVKATTTCVNTKDWQRWTTVYAHVYLNAGPQKIRIHAAGKDFNLDWIEFSNEVHKAVTVNGRRIIVQGKPFYIKGVCWNPVPAGQHQNEGVNFADYVEQDGLLMQQAGINTVRTYWPITDRAVLDSLYAKGIYVINTLYLEKGITYDIAGTINAVKDHPALLMWIIGNEWNYNFLYTAGKPGGLSFNQTIDTLNQLADQIKSLDTTHPLLTTYGGKLPDKWVIDAMPNIDIWGLQIYRELNFDNAFTGWKERSGKPMFLSEYGADAWNALINAPDETAQAEATRILTRLLMDNSVVDNPNNSCSGGTIFEWADEWWKAGNPDTHDSGGNAPGFGPYPDKRFNEEYWGIVRIDRTIRPAYYELKKLFNP